SFEKTMTDANGKFRVLVIKGTSLNTVSVQPDDYAVLTQKFGTKRGDLGTLKVSKGQRIIGTVVDADGKPLSGVKVTAESDQQTFAGQNVTRRDATTDASGKFALAPAGPDQYQVTVDHEQFTPVRISITADAAPAPIAFRPPPLNVIRVH